MGSGGNAGLGWRFLLVCMGALAYGGVFTAKLKGGWGGIACGGVYMYS